MRPSLRSFAALSAACLLAVSGLTSAAHGQSARAVAASARVLQPVEPSQTVQLKGHLPPWANPGNDLGAVATDKQLNNLHLILSRAPAVEAAFDQLLVDQQDPSSPRYHQWLTPQQNSAQYGIAPADLAAVTNWLRAQGLSVDDIAAGGVFITFSGSVSAVQTAFATTLHNFSHANLSLYAPTQEPSVPAAIAGVITSVAGLDDNRMTPHNHLKGAVAGTNAAGAGVNPLTDLSDGTHAIAPADWNTIYDVAPVLSAGITGTTSKVLILDYGRVAAADISNFQSYLGVASTVVPNTILLSGSADPGYDGVNGWQAEGTLDIQRVNGTAPGAPIDYFIATNSFTNTFSQLQYNISTLNDPIVSMSFGSCESTSSSSAATTFDTYFKTGSAQGIGNYVSSGDTAAAGCDSNGSAVPTTTQVLAQNLICSSGYATCVGGTEFSEGTGTGTYWSTSNNSTTKGSALSYIPEGGWNESYCSTSTALCYPIGSGGGVSAVITKPSFQTGTGVPADGYRDTPDVAFTSASGHDGYIVCLLTYNCATSSTGFYIFGGTSAAAPSMAGVAALLNQKLAARQGNLNPLFYTLAAKAGVNVFHDVTVATSGVASCSIGTPSMCNNSTPARTTLTGGLAGYAVTAGYDQVTGLGSIDVNNLLVASSATSTTLAVVTNNNPGIAGVSLNLIATLTPGASSATPTGTVQFYSNGISVGSAPIASNKATLAYTFATAGTYAITAVYSGDSNFGASTAPAFSETINAGPSFAVTPSATALTVVSGATTGNTITVTLNSLNTFSGVVTYNCVVTKPTQTDTAAGSCSYNPATANLTSGSAATSTLTINTTLGTSGVLNVAISATSGSLTVTGSSLVVTVVAPGFTITPTATTLTVASGATTANTTTLTLKSTNGFVGNVTLPCTIGTVTGGITTTNTSCTVTPATVPLTSGGTATATLTLNTTLGAGGSFIATVSGSGTTTGATLAATSAVTVPVTVTAPGITLTPSAATLSFTSGATTGNTDTITVASTNNFAGTVTLNTCTISTSAAVNQPTCAIAPTSVPLTAGGSATAVVTISSTTAHSSLTMPAAPMLHRGVEIGTPVFALLLCLLPFRKRRAIRSLMALVFLFGSLAMVSGCGGGGTPSAPVTQKSSAGTYTVTISATGTSTGSTLAATGQTTFTVNIN